MGNRVALISTPRSGNNWARAVLADALGLQPMGVHNFLDVGDLPDDCILGVHWPREPNFQRFLRDNGFRIVVLARHPLDSLISMTRFAAHEPATKAWLGGSVGAEAAAGAAPESAAFLAFATSFGADTALRVSYQWWHDPAAVRVTYETMVADPAATLQALAGSLGRRMDPQALDSALERHSLEAFRALPNKHGWQGRPGLWRDLLTARSARRIHDQHRHIFRALGYAVRPKLFLTAARARANWARLA